MCSSLWVFINISTSDLVFPDSLHLFSSTLGPESAHCAFHSSGGDKLYNTEIQCDSKLSRSKGHVTPICCSHNHVLFDRGSPNHIKSCDSPLCPFIALCSTRACYCRGCGRGVQELSVARRQNVHSLDPVLTCLVPYPSIHPSAKLSLAGSGCYKGWGVPRGGHTSGEAFFFLQARAVRGRVWFQLIINLPPPRPRSWI